MKKILVVVLTIVLAFGLVACESESTVNGTGNEQPGDKENEYAGVWMANVKASVTAEKVEYETYVIKLNTDGTGSYRDKPGTWEYNKDSNSVVLALTNEGVGIVLEIDEVDGLVVLKYFQDVYYRETDFVPNT